MQMSTSIRAMKCHLQSAAFYIATFGEIYNTFFKSFLKGLIKKALFFHTIIKAKGHYETCKTSNLRHAVYFITGMFCRVHRVQFSWMGTQLADSIFADVHKQACQELYIKACTLIL